jgi:hypothetical protein
VANSFEAEVSEAAAHLDLCYQKLAIPMRQVNGFMVKLKTNPYDSFLVHQGRHVALELKSLEEHGSFPLANLEDHQREGLTRVLQAGGRGYVLVNMRRLKGKSDNQAWFLDWSYWDEQEALLKGKGPKGADRKSVPYPFFQTGLLWQPLPRRRVKNGLGETALVWDLRVLLEVETPDYTPLLPYVEEYDPENPWALEPVG